LKVDFRNSKLAKDCSDDRSRKRAFGAACAKKLRDRLSVLLAAGNLHELRHAPGRFHELLADRKGQFAADLEQPHRLIFEPVIPPNELHHHKNAYDWTRITHVRILEIVDYHN
jgi:proteic killer suppression protein